MAAKLLCPGQNLMVINFLETGFMEKEFMIILEFSSEKSLVKWAPRCNKNQNMFH